MRIKKSDAIQALIAIRRLIEGELNVGIGPRAQALPLDGYFVGLCKHLEKEKYLFEGKTRVPIAYTIHIPADDLVELDEKDLVEALPTSLAKQLTEYVKQKNYLVVNGPIKVRLEETEEEQASITSAFKPYSAPAPTPQAAPPSPPKQDVYGTTVAKNPLAYLEIWPVGGKEAPEVIPIAEFPIVLGREAPNSTADIQFEADSLVGRQHLKIDRESVGRFTVTDLESKNFTKLEGTQLEPNRAYPLPSDSLLELAGQINIRFIETYGTRRAARA